MSDITKNQHVVPHFYLNSWKVDNAEKVYLYDLVEKKVSTPNPSSVLVRRYYYESDRAFPDNSLEKILSEMEGRVSAVISEFSDLLSGHQWYSQSKKLCDKASSLLSDEKQQIIKEFAAYQYLRIPGAIEQKAYELQPANIAEDVLEEQMKPANFVASGFQYIKERFFQNLGMSLFFAFEDNFLTSDWPCFDFRDSDQAPLIGEEIGNSHDVYLMFPLTPRALLILFPRLAFDPSRRINRALSRTMSSGQVKNVNKLTIQQSNRWIVSNKEAPYIFKVASKRKRENWVKK